MNVAIKCHFELITKFKALYQQKLTILTNVIFKWRASSKKKDTSILSALKKVIGVNFDVVGIV